MPPPLGQERERRLWDTSQTMRTISLMSGWPVMVARTCAALELAHPALELASERFSAAISARKLECGA